jgi:hypothetical protein
MVFKTSPSLGLTQESSRSHSRILSVSLKNPLGLTQESSRSHSRILSVLTQESSRSSPKNPLGLTQESSRPHSRVLLVLKSPLGPQEFSQSSSVLSVLAPRFHPVGAIFRIWKSSTRRPKRTVVYFSSSAINKIKYDENDRRRMTTTDTFRQGPLEDFQLVIELRNPGDRRPWCWSS